jgi:hypothetical protein
VDFPAPCVLPGGIAEALPLAFLSGVGNRFFVSLSARGVGSSYTWRRMKDYTLSHSSTPVPFKPILTKENRRALRFSFFSQGCCTSNFNECLVLFLFRLTVT